MWRFARSPCWAPDVHVWSQLVCPADSISTLRTWACAPAPSSLTRPSMPWQVPQTFVFRVCEVYLACCKGFERFLLLTNHCGDQYAYREGQTERTLTHFLRDGCFGTMEPSRMHVLVASLGRQQNSRIHVDRVLFNFFLVSFCPVLCCVLTSIHTRSSFGATCVGTRPSTAVARIVILAFARPPDVCLCPFRSQKAQVS